MFLFYFFFNDTATTEIYTLSLHDALPIWSKEHNVALRGRANDMGWTLNEYELAVLEESGESRVASGEKKDKGRSEEHTSELQSRRDLVCRLLLEKKKKQTKKKNKTKNKNT